MTGAEARRREVAVLREQGGCFDLWRHKLADLDGFTYVRKGQPCSRIDAAYASTELLQWAGDSGAGVRIAMTRECEPLSPDHRSIVVRLPGPFTRAKPEGLCTTVSAVPRPTRQPSRAADTGPPLMPGLRPKRGHSSVDVTTWQR